MYFKTETDVVQNLIDFFPKFWMPEDLPIGRILREKKYGGTWLISEKTKVF